MPKIKTVSVSAPQRTALETGVKYGSTPSFRLRCRAILLKSDAQSDAPQVRTSLKSDAQSDAPQVRTSLKSDAQSDAPQVRTSLKSDAQSDAPQVRTSLKSDAQSDAPQVRTSLSVARELGCCEVSVNDWMKRFREQGMDGLKVAEGRGRKSILGQPGDLEAVRRAVAGNRQRISLAKAELEQELGKEFSPLTLRRFLKKTVDASNAFGG